MNQTTVDETTVDDTRTSPSTANGTTGRSRGASTAVRDMTFALLDSQAQLSRMQRWLAATLLTLGVLAPFVGVGHVGMAFHPGEDGSVSRTVPSVAFDDAPEYTSIASTLLGLRTVTGGPVQGHPRSLAGLVIYAALLLLVLLTVMALVAPGTGGRRIVSRPAVRTTLLVLLAGALLAAWFTHPLDYRGLEGAPEHVPNPHSYAVDLLVLGLVAAAHALGRPTPDADSLR